MAASPTGQPTAAVEPEPAAPQAVSPEQVAAAKKLAQDMGVVIKEDAAGHVILLDTAAKRSWVDDYQLQEMLVFPQLESLTVEGPSISHVVAPQIAKLTVLSALAMRNTLITNEGIAELKGLPSLKVIDLRLSPLLDDTVLESLAEMPQLRGPTAGCQYFRSWCCRIIETSATQRTRSAQLSRCDQGGY